MPSGAGSSYFTDVVKEGDILGEMFGGLQVLGHDEPHGGHLRAGQLGEDRAALYVVRYYAAA